MVHLGIPRFPSEWHLICFKLPLTRTNNVGKQMLINSSKFITSVLKLKLANESFMNLLCIYLFDILDWYHIDNLFYTHIYIHTDRLEQYIELFTTKKTSSVQILLNNWLADDLKLFENCNELLVTRSMNFGKQVLFNSCSFTTLVWRWP